MANRPFVLQEFSSRTGYKRNHPARSGGLQMGEGRATNPAQWGLYPRGGVKLQEFLSRAGYKRNHPAWSGLREGQGRISTSGVGYYLPCGVRYYLILISQGGVFQLPISRGEAFLL
ncbi:hypothetical protein ACLB2K_049446 [Fragaria x ananassa]